MPPKKTDAATPIDSLKHKKEKRMNIPTKELRGFVEEDEKKPKTILYPRDPSLDPQLVWKGKDEQDRKDLAVPAVPVYIQEKIQPQAIIEDLRRTKGKGSFTPSLFADFNGIKFEEMIEFYRHQQNWSNRMILGDSLLVMNSLSEKEGLKGKVQMIYIDPPYGIKFGSNWQVSTRKREVKDGKAEDASREPEVVKAFRDTWEKGIHSYLAYLRDRLVVSRDLLTETGSVFVQIGDENVHLVRSLLDEVFGSENFISQILYRRGGFQTSEALPNTFDFILWYAKQHSVMKFRALYVETPVEEWFDGQQRWVEFPDGARQDIKKGFAPSSRGRVHSHRASYSATGGESSHFAVNVCGTDYFPPAGRGWSTNENGFKRLIASNRLLAIGKSLRFKPYYDDFPFRVLTNGWMDTVTSGFGEDKIYVVQTASMIVQRCLLMTTDPGDLVLDPTCGSGTTAYVSELWGRRWITIDTSRVSIALARTRLMAARFPYYLLDDSIEGAKKETEISGKIPPDRKYESDIKKGFVSKRVPHVTLKSIANNMGIDEIYDRWQKKLEPIREKLNRLRKVSWKEWEVPREADKDWPKEAKSAHEEWWKLRQERQKEIDASIAKKADTERLYDQPYEDKKKIRVTGPFTVESLSPHRMLEMDLGKETGTRVGDSGSDNRGQFVTMIIDNLKAAGVQNTKKKERLKILPLEPHAGTWIHAIGEYMEGEKPRRVAIFIGPENGTVGPEMVREAAKEAVQGIGFDTLIACGFAFDPHVSEEATRFGKLTVLIARMNPDLAMGQELLKKTGAGNLFMIFGEPDLKISKGKDGKVTVDIKGVDVYDPTTGVIRSNTTDDIACWFIDTDYNGESFFVRHAYFTGGDEPFQKLKRALRAEIDEAAWQSIYSTKSRPFDAPRSGKIAVKVINHYGDEVLKVYQT